MPIAEIAQEIIGGTEDEIKSVLWFLYDRQLALFIAMLEAETKRKEPRLKVLALIELRIAEALGGRRSQVSKAGRSCIDGHLGSHDER